MVLVVHALALPLESRRRRLVPPSVAALRRRRVGDRRVRRRQRQRVLQLRRWPQDAQRVRRQLLRRPEQAAVNSVLRGLLS